MSRDDENFGKDSDESIAPLLQPSNPIITEPHPSGHVIPTQSSSPKPVSPADSSSLTRSPLRMISRFSGSEASESRLPSEGARQVFQDTSSALDTGTPPFPQRLTVPAHNPPSNDPDGSCSFVHVGSLSNIETSCPQSPNTSSAQRASPSSAQRASPSSAQRASPSSAQRASPSSATAGVEVNFSARLVSASGPVVGAPTGWRRATDAALSRRSRSALVSNTVRNEDANGGVGRGVRDGQVSRGAQDSSGRQLLGIRGRAARGTSQPGVLAGSRRLLRPDERFSRGSELIPPDDDHWVNGESSLARHRDEAEGLESAPWGQGEDRTPLGAIGGGDSLEPGAIDPQTPGPTPAEIRRALEQSQNTLPLLVLLVVHFVFTHLMDITAFALGTAVLAGLDRRLRAHADVRDMKNVVSLVVVAAAAISTVLLSALILRGQPWGGELLRGLILAAPRPPLHSLSDVIRAVAVVDLWARLISVAVKVFAALLASRQRNFSSSTGCLNTGAIARSCANSRCCSGVIPRQTSCRLCTWRLRSGGDRSRGRASPFPSSRPGEHAAEHELHGLVNSLRGAGRTALGERSAGAGVTWRDRFCTGGIVSAVMCCVGVILPCSVRRRRGWSSRFQGDNGWWDSGGEGRSGEGILGEDSQGEGAGGEAHGQRTVEEADREISTAELLGSSGRQRRIRALLEMAFLLYRTLLPVPAWLEYYGKDGDNFAAGYLVLKDGVDDCMKMDMVKCMVVSLRVERLARAVCYVRRGDLERGKFATPEEVAEAGSPDCSICYERITRPLLLPCEHLFCGECVAEWLERERTCPLCRSEVPTSNPIPKALQDGRTALRPQLL